MQFISSQIIRNNFSRKQGRPNQPHTNLVVCSQLTKLLTLTIIWYICTK